jgi:hypothetical protein
MLLQNTGIQPKDCTAQQPRSPPSIMSLLSSVVETTYQNYVDALDKHKRPKEWPTHIIKKIIAM